MKAKEIWMRCRWNELLSGSVKEWIGKAMGNLWCFSKEHWDLIFGFTVWSLWRWRNIEVLGDCWYVGLDKVLSIRMLVKILVMLRSFW